ncbi:MAG: hypothetical protein QM725_00430 [Lacibacter sp.]
MLNKNYLIILLLFQCTVLTAQQTFLLQKKGKTTYQKVNFSPLSPQLYSNNILEYEKNVKELINFFLQQSVILNENKGFDLKILLSSNETCNSQTGKRIIKPWQYGLQSELRFLFEMLLPNEKKWTVEPPTWSFYINQTETGGHGGLYNDGDESSFLKQLFLVFPFVKEIAPGVHYYNCPAQTCGQIVVFNPARPNYWLPVTVREVVQAKLKFYNTDKEGDKAVYNFIKPIAGAMSEEELNAPAFYGSDDAILNVNGKKQGLQLMRFNPAYWDQSLPVSAIQYFTIAHNEFGYNCFNIQDWEKSKEEYFRNNGHMEFWQEIPRSVDLSRLATFIQKNK